jgi:hypothetical protein
MVGVCPKCEEEFKAGSRILRRLTCQLCGKIKGTTQMYCGGPVGFMCDDCKSVVNKYIELREKYKKFHEELKSQFRNNSDK